MILRDKDENGMKYRMVFEEAEEAKILPKEEDCDIYLWSGLVFIIVTLFRRKEKKNKKIK